MRKVMIIIIVFLISQHIFAEMNLSNSVLTDTSKKIDNIELFINGMKVNTISVEKVLKRYINSNNVFIIETKSNSYIMIDLKVLKLSALTFTEANDFYGNGKVISIQFFFN